MKILIYSTTTVEKALDCIEVGVDRIGVLVGKEGEPFPCTVHDENERNIVTVKLVQSINSVGVVDFLMQHF